jgi:hypothetical protein
MPYKVTPILIWIAPVREPGHRLVKDASGRGAGALFFRHGTSSNPGSGATINAVSSSGHIAIRSLRPRRLPAVFRPGTASRTHQAGELEALVCVRTGPTTSPEQFVAYLTGEPTVAQVWRVAADIDAVVRVVCSGLAELEAVVARMRHLGGAEHTATHLVLSP